MSSPFKDLIVPNCVTSNLYTSCRDCPFSYLKREDAVLFSCLVDDINDISKNINKENNK